LKKILVLHGPNLNMLGEREVDVYGNIKLEEINRQLKTFGQDHGFIIEACQSNSEGDLVTMIQKAKGSFDALVINPAAFTHTSIAIRDALSAIDIPIVEVHLSNIYQREEFRQRSLTAPIAKGIISGFGVNSYLLGVRAAIEQISR